MDLYDIQNDYDDESMARCTGDLNLGKRLAARSPQRSGTKPPPGQNQPEIRARHLAVTVDVREAESVTRPE